MTLGETVFAAVLQVVFDRLASQEVVNFFRTAKFDESLVNKLKTLMLAVEKLLLDAEEKQFSKGAISNWLNELKHWFYRAEEVVDEIATEALRLSIEKELPPQPESLGKKLLTFIPAFSNSSLLCNSITPKIKEVVEMLETMLSQKDALGLREAFVGRAPEAQSRTSTCLLEYPKVYGRDNVKDDIINLLLSEEAKRARINVVPIVGMGGIGKTTLAKLVYNDPRVKETFDMKVWVCVSDHFDVFQVTRSILQSITGNPYSDSLDLNFLQTRLSTALQEKRFLLVLDDVWNKKYEDWERLRAPFSVGAYGSYIIVTTRNDEVASMMSRTRPFCLKPISDVDAWSLFSAHAFEGANSLSNSSLEDIGKKIVHKCQGLPLAIKTLGGLLRCANEINGWEETLHSNLWDLPNDVSDLKPALLLSYYYLPSHLKRCFSYCAIFPKDYKIKRQQLVLLWMAENFVQTTNNERRKEDEGDGYLRQLLSRCLLEKVDETYVKMHDLMHDLAQTLSRDFLLSHEHETPKEVLKKARHFSYFAGSYDRFSRFQAIHESKYLRTFLQCYPTERLWDPFYLSNRATTAIIPSLSCLQVLSVSGYENITIPESIGCLKQLRYLDVSQTNITRLPESVSNLYNLQTLLLSNCYDLKKLPEGMGSLALLRHLDITRTYSLLQMPKHMNKLKFLQTLTDFVVGESGGSKIKELAELQQIRGKLALRQLQNVTTPKDAFYANISRKKLIDELTFEFDNVDCNDSEKVKDVLDNLKPPESLKSLTIQNYPGTRFPSWLDPGCVVYANLTYLCLKGCRNCSSLPPLGQLSSLEELEISDMEYMVRVMPEFYGDHNNSGLRAPFPALESLKFKNMKEWEVWSNVDVKGNVVSFPRLRMLRLHDCPKLKGNLPVHVPSLTEIDISGCKELGGLLLPVSLLDSLEVTVASAIGMPSVINLKLRGLVQLVDLPCEVAMLSFLRNLKIHDCHNLMSLAKVELPHTLESLEIYKCPSLECLPELTHLHKLSLHSCQRLRWIPGYSLPTSLTSLSVEYCEMWEFPIPMERMQHYTSLKRLHLVDVSSHLLSFPLGVFPNLYYLCLWRCKGLEKVYIPEGIGNDNLTSLYELRIKECPQLEMIGKETGRGETTILPTPNLTDLCITDCERVMPVLIEVEGEVLLPKFRSLTICKSNKIISERPLNLRKSLLRFPYLMELNIEDEEVECFPDPDQGWGSLPTSLTQLGIVNFPKLRRLDGKGLQTLTSLKNLWIFDCPQLESLPKEGLPPSLDRLDIVRCPKLEKFPEDGLPPSLAHLKIYECPMLVEKCQPEKGMYWSNIRHIPCIFVNYNSLTTGV